MRSKDNIKHIFSSKLRDFEPELPDGLWSKIEADLSSIEKDKNVKRSVVIKWIAAVTSAAAMIVGMLFFVSNDKIGESIKPNSYSSVIIPTIENTPENILPQDSLVKDISFVSKRTSANLYAQEKRHTQNSALEDNIQQVVSQIEVENPKVKDIDDSIVEKETNRERGNETEMTAGDTRELYDKIAEFERAGQEIDFFDIKYTKKKNPQKIIIGAGGGAGLITSDKSMQMGQLKNSSFNNSSSNNSEIKDPSLSLGENNSSGANPIDLTPAELDHKQPITFGFTISKSLNDRFSLETGIMYTYLYSKVKSEFRTSYQAYESQSFHYLGIPVNISYTLATFEKINFYLSAGGMIEKDIHGFQKAKENKNKVSSSSDYSFKNTRSIHQKNMQLSTRAMIGAMYPIHDKLNLYATFGGAYYFDAKNKYATIYSERKLHMDINVGIKFDLR